LEEDGVSSMMVQTYTKGQKLKQFFLILLPILITQLSMYAMNFFDTIMAGNYSSTDLAGVAIGSSIWVPIFTGLSGILLSVTPIVSQLIGAGEKKGVSFSVIQGIYVSTVMAFIVIGIGSIFLDPFLNMMQLDDKVQQIAHDYLVALSFGIFPLFMYQVCRSFIDALGMTRTTMIITLLSLPVNVALNYVFIYGALFVPPFGGVGAGYASAITYWFILFVAIWIIDQRVPFQQFRIWRQVQPVDLRKWKEILIIGVPIGLSIFFETSIFSAVTLLMSPFGTVTVASHQAALNFASMLYMVPLSISMALTIVVGFEVGARRFKDASTYSFLGISIAVGLSFFCGLLLFIYKDVVAALYTDDSNVLTLTSQFLLYAVFFQLSDAIQAPVQGALRGYKDVNVTFLMAFISYWIIGLPLGYMLANFTLLGPFGYWLGLITGLAAGAVTLSYRLWWVQKKYRKQHSI
jgi:multidrug resistance protein, MATE family